MILSMTGFGKVSSEIAYGTNGKSRKVVIEIRSLNSKQLDLNFKLPQIYREKEMELRTICNQQIERGRVDFSIYFDEQNGENVSAINKSLVHFYYNELKTISAELGDQNNNLLDLVMRLPDVLKAEKLELNEEEWKAILALVQKAIEQFTIFRKDEGKKLAEDLSERIKNITAFLSEIEKLEPNRLTNIKTRIKKGLNEFFKDEQIDGNRFEQELIYYLEKIDITEEKVRLKSHCDYFLQNMQSEASEGRKLGFISQEIGREINTIGSKANDAVMQQLVVKMKDELEKIKEQSLNIL